MKGITESWFSPRSVATAPHAPTSSAARARTVHLCEDLDALVAGIEDGAGAVFVAEEGLFGKDTRLADWVQRQPAWSDLPFIVLTSSHDEPKVAAWRENLTASLHNVALLERPLHTITLTTTVRAALRARSRQYEVRDLIEERERAAARLEALVAERTRALQEANAELHAQMEERERVEAALRQAQKIEAIGQLTGGIAHDFNNLLMVIMAGLDMLQRDAAPARRERLLDTMRQAAQRGSALTKQLLAFSRRQALKPEPLNVARQIGKMRDLLDRSLRGDVHVSFKFPSDLWSIEVDAGELELVVLNLAVNARDAMPNGGRSRSARRTAPLSTTEDSWGTTSSSRSRTPERGCRPRCRRMCSSRSTPPKEAGKGSGLGLAQVHGFVNQSNGGVRIHSVMGRGTTINLYLPRSDKVPRDEPSSAEAPLDRAGQRYSGLVLLVEDDDEVAKLTTEMLGQLGFDVIRTASAAAALGALANDRPVDLVFSDIMMPGGMNGVDLAREIKNRRRELPVLLTSGYAEAVRSEAEAEGFPILPKPYLLDELSSALQMLARN